MKLASKMVSWLPAAWRDGPMHHRWLSCLFAVWAACSATGDSIKVHVDFERTNGAIRALHGLNKGPIAWGGMIDLTERQRELGAPFVRLHDCQWPYPEVVDIHAIFRDPEADPERPESYDFALTDEYLAALQKTGARVVYRLGESIEHGRVKRFVHPPRNAERWAAACLGIIRHYNEGWAGGFHYRIPYWEIWNEPENRPAMWSGTDEDYFRLYQTTVRAIKRQFPQLKVGGPAVGYSGRFEAGKFVPSDFVSNFLALCRRESIPLDFFSWHCYTADPMELVGRARAVRRMLDTAGFAATESHLNEWNYLPGNSWEPFGKTAAPELRQAFYERMGGVPGAAFVTTALIELQDAPVDVCNFYHGETGGFGLFNEFGVPNLVFDGLGAFNQVAKLPQRMGTAGGVPGKLSILAGRDPQTGRTAILISNFGSPEPDLELEFSGSKEALGYTIRSMGAGRSWNDMRHGQLDSLSAKIALKLAAPGVALIEVQPN